MDKLPMAPQIKRMHYVSYAGFAALLTWLGVMSSEWDAHFAFSPQNLSGLLWVAIGTAALLYAIIFHFTALQPSQKVMRMGDIVVTGILILSGSLVTTVSTGLSTPFLVLILLISASCAAWGLLRWGAMLGKLARDALIKVIVANAGIVLASKIVFAWLLPDHEALASSLLPALPALSLFGLWFADQIVARKGHAFYTRHNLKSLVGVVVFVALFSVALKLLDILTSTAPSSFVSEAIGFCVLLAVIFWLFILKKPLDFYSDVRALLVITAIGAFAFVLTKSEFASGLLYGIRELTRFYLFLLMADIAFHSDESSFTIFGIGWAFCGLPRLPFCWVNETVLTQISFGDGGYLSLTLALLLLLILLVMAFSLIKTPPGLRPPLSDMRPYVLEVHNNPSTLSSFCETLSERYSLTPREKEITELICRGRDKAYIADTLFISGNTVKYHSKNLYRKIGINSKQELIDLFETRQ